MTTTMHVVVNGRLVDETGAGVADHRVELHVMYVMAELRATTVTAVTGHFVLEAEVLPDVWRGVTRLRVVMPDAVERIVYWHDFDAVTAPPEGFDLGEIVCPRAKLDGWLVTLGTGVPQHLYHGNHGEWFVDNDVLWPLLLDEFEQAQSNIHVTQLFWGLDTVRDEGITEALGQGVIKASRRGVDVRLVLNDFPIDLRDNIAHDDVWESRLQSETAHSVGLGEINLGRLSLHAKLVLVDGERGYSLGSPLKRELFDAPAHRLHHPPRGSLKSVVGSGAGTRVAWHDVSFRLEGPAVAGLEAMFALQWRLARSESLATPPRSPARDEGFSVQLVRSMPGQVYLDASEPLRSHGETGILESYLRAIRHATDFIYLENQYFTEPAITRALLGALRQRPALVILIVLNNALDIPMWTGLQLDQVRELHRRALELAPRHVATLQGSVADAVGAAGTSVTDVLRAALRLNGVWLSQDASIEVLDAKRWRLHDEHTFEVYELRRTVHGVEVYRGRVGLFQLYKVEAAQSGPTRVMPIYVHSKVAIVDDCWATVGSANLDGASLLWSETAAHWDEPYNFRPTGVERNIELNATFFDGIAGCPPSSMPRRLREQLFTEHLHGSTGGVATVPTAGATWLEAFRATAHTRLEQLLDAPRHSAGDARLLPWVAPESLRWPESVLGRLGLEPHPDRLVLLSEYDDA